MEVSIRLAKPEEIEAIIELQTLSLSGNNFNNRKYNENQISSLITSQAEARKNAFLNFESIFVAEQSDKIIGFIAFANNFKLASRYGIYVHIYGIYVHPDYMCKGIGGKLMKEAELTYIAQRTRILFVLSSLESIDFYQKHGYSIVRKSGFYSSEYIWIPCLLLKKELIPLTSTERLLRKFVLIVIFVALAIILLKLIFK
ncbi:GNAT family N-acetyltransferase [Pseudanabaena sp. UWO311]|uniref:GNAT family N-acetyltransferase n=1 Tax=Pseudanabaena sp. UWO311 TaxID=2487337 RepID=UPI00115A4720|nr:GNAT family N-acetyltransferase [Pseudanabaena sp. UWO311]TYQ24332.1 GNAT family N-acetyltransferase [Pseudanabaena sp. UWO311]